MTRLSLPTLFAAFALSACVGDTGGYTNGGAAGIGARALLSDPFPEYAAQVKVAQQIGLSCPRYSFDNELHVALTAARPDTSQGSLVAIRNTAGIELATDVEARAFQARHGVVIGQSDLCAAGDAERARGSGIGALIVPV